MTTKLLCGLCEDPIAGYVWALLNLNDAEPCEENYHLCCIGCCLSNPNDMHDCWMCRNSVEDALA